MFIRAVTPTMSHRTHIRTALVLAMVLVAAVGAVATPAAATGTSQAENCTFPVTRTDATGIEVTVDAEPQTVVTLGPSAAQTMWEIGAREKVVGVTKFASYLDGSETRTNVSGAGYTAVVTEKVVDLDPDLVLAPNIISNDTVMKLRESGLTVYKFHEATSLSDVEAKTRLTGRLTGACEGATQRADEMNATLERIRTAVSGTDSPRVLYYMGGGYTAGANTYIDDVITAAGGTNVAAEADIDGYGQISPEVVVSDDPQWILRSSNAGPLPQTDAYNGTTAVQSGQVLVLDANYTSQPAPRTVQVVERLATTFHPDAFASETTDTTTETATTQQTTSTAAPTTATTSTTTQTAVPGMGVLTALFAVALLGFVRRVA